MKYKDADEVMEAARNENVEVVDFVNVDFWGRWRHMSLPVSQLNAELFQKGIGIAGATAGYRGLESSDIQVIPDPKTAFINPFGETKTLSLLCEIYDTEGNRLEEDPRYIAQKAEAYAASFNLGKSLWLPELEYYIFDDVRFVSGVKSCSYTVDAEEAFWNMDREETPNLGYKIPLGMGGAQSIPPKDKLFTLRAEMVRRIESVGIPVRYHHHEGGSAGQVEIELLFDTLTQTADSIMVAKYIIRNTATEYNKTVTFMPKPLYGDEGCGLHFHIYFTDGERSLFWDPQGYGGLNKKGHHFIGGLLKHTSAIMGFCNCTTNSYRRFASEGLAAPVNMSFSVGNRTAAVRIPAYSINEKEERIEYRIADAAGNIYFSLASILMAGLSGLDKEIDPSAEGFGPFDVNIYELSDEEKSKITTCPTSLEESLKSLKENHDFLLQDNVFTENLIERWIQVKIDREVKAMAARPHPYEYYLYYEF